MVILNFAWALEFRQTLRTMPQYCSGREGALEIGSEQVDNNGTIVQWGQYKRQTHNTVSVKYECDYNSGWSDLWAPHFVCSLTSKSDIMREKWKLYFIIKQAKR
jgi:hypothetical protein